MVEDFADLCTYLYVLTDEAYDQNVRWASPTGTATGTRRC